MMHLYLDENFLISLVHLTLKTWIKTTEAEERKQPEREDPFQIFDVFLRPTANSSHLQYLELQTIILQSK